MKVTWRSTTRVQDKSEGFLKVPCGSLKATQKNATQKRALIVGISLGINIRTNCNNSYETLLQ